MWEDYLNARGGERIDISPTDVAMMMALLKIARIASGKAPKVDSFVDLAGYAACGGECAFENSGDSESPEYESADCDISY